MRMMMRVACFCPTYARPELVENTIALFLGQDYDGPKKLFVLDDGGQLEAENTEELQIVSTSRRYRSLPLKYDALSDMAAAWNPDIVTIWDDDDLYLPHHLSSAVSVLAINGAWVKPDWVWSTYSGSPVIESAVGRFWASATMRWNAWVRMGGVPRTHRADFDQQFMSVATRLYGEALPQCTDPLETSFCFRWQDTRTPHSQSFIRSPDDTTWYDRMEAVGKLPFHGKARPKLSDVSQKTLGYIANKVIRSVQ